MYIHLAANKNNDKSPYQSYQGMLFYGCQVSMY